MIIFGLETLEQKIFTGDIMLRSLFYKIKWLFAKGKDDVLIVERDAFAQEMMEKFNGNTELLKAIEQGMNKYAKKNEYVSLTD